MEQEKLDTESLALKKRFERDCKSYLFQDWIFQLLEKKTNLQDTQRNQKSLPLIVLAQIFHVLPHRFINIRGHFQGDLNMDLNMKFNDGRRLLDFEDLDCNCCNCKACPYGGLCRR